jgi:hypothetical protein
MSAAMGDILAFRGVRTVNAGEASGELGYALRQLVDYMDWRVDLVTQQTSDDVSSSSSSRSCCSWSG